MSRAILVTSLTRFGMILAWTSVSSQRAGLMLISSSYGEQSESSMKSYPKISKDPNLLSSRSLTCIKVSFMTSMMPSVTFDLNSASDCRTPYEMRYAHKSGTLMAAVCFSSLNYGCFFWTLRLVRCVSRLACSGEIAFKADPSLLSSTVFPLAPKFSVV